MGRLFWKIFFAFWLTLIAVAAATVAAFALLRGAQTQVERDLALGPPGIMATQLAAATLRHGGAEALRDWLREAPRMRGAFVFAVDERGIDVLGREVPPAALERARELVAEGRRAARVVAAPNGERYLLFAQAAGEPRRGVRRTAPPQPPPAWLLIAIGGVASLAVSALLAWYLARPIRSLRWAFRAAADGRLDTRVRPLMKGRRDEIADLGAEFDQMAQQLQKLVAAQRRLLHDVSHELRSPLARLQAAIGLARQDPARLGPSLDRIEREAARLDELVGEVLALARLEGGTAAGATETVDLADLVAGIAADARFEAEATDRKLALESADHVLVRGRTELLHRAIENVVRNAVKYTAEATTVEIHLSSSGGRARLTVRDHGPGIPPADAERIFEPFYRSALSPSPEGFGLGLAIAYAAVAAHGGTIRAANAPSGGLLVTVELPA
jgi:two-component system, OmpR family, sensor kinase